MLSSYLSMTDAMNVGIGLKIPVLFLGMQVGWLHGNPHGSTDSKAFIVHESSQMVSERKGITDAKVFGSSLNWVIFVYSIK